MWVLQITLIVESKTTMKVNLNIQVNLDLGSYSTVKMRNPTMLLESAKDILNRVQVEEILNN